MLINQQTSKDLKVSPVAPSSRTLTDVMAQNQERKYEMARAAIASGAWDTPQGVIVHEVREDETLWQITQIYQIDAAAIAASNGISAATELQPGMKLVIPPVSGLVHKVKPGDTLESIATYYNIPKGEILKYTSLESPDFLAVDQPLVIPGNVATLIQVKDEHIKKKLIAERERLERRLNEIQGKPVLVSSNTTNSAARSPEAAIKKQPKFTTHQVQNGDTIETVARRYGTSQKAIIEANKLDNPHWLELNQELKIPSNDTVPTLQTVASVNVKPSKQVPSTVSDQFRTSPVPELTASALPDTARSNANNLGTRVTAATPMVPPTIASAPRLSPWDGLMQLTGGNATKNLPTQPAQEDLSAQQRPATSSTSLPVASEPAIRVATALFPFTPDKLLEQPNASSSNARTSLPSGAPAVEPSVQLPRPTFAVPSIASSLVTSVTEQNPSLQRTPSEVSAQPAAEPSVRIPRQIAAAISISVPSEISAEQGTVTQNTPASAQTTGQPVSEPTVQIPNRVAAATLVPAVPSTRVVEQNSSVQQIPVNNVVPQPAAEPKVQVPARTAAALAPSIPSSSAVEQNAKNGAPTEVALLPDPESRVRSLEVQRLESEVDQLNKKVREAEAKEAMRRAEAMKLASANLNPSSDLGRNFDAGREAIARPGDRSGGVAPELPTLTASAYLPDINSYGLSSGFIWPADGVLTSGFGWRWGRVHQGIDIAAPVGTPVMAAATGVIDYAGWNDGGYGNMIDIRHPDGTITRYGHLSAIYVTEGQSVSQTQVIAAMGSTGFSTGPHLHFEIRPNGGSAVDPMAFLASIQR
ncbi:LysM peptidoglycan-binding domain-containing protein [Tumidithrix elongata RA019]|uniref:LysM peptidoglycan-binding domain-containing protein n=2 Tax=Tumidithrix TaxID=3088355 RepID=A0AAW9Q3Z5_9CYAN|nr:LysM peptidoglycan-binding domain-containing protein [Tumidithrix elongata RA019]